MTTATLSKTNGILARFPSRCPSCKLPIAVDQLITRFAGTYVHVDCEANREESQYAEYALWLRANTSHPISTDPDEADGGLSFDGLPKGRSLVAVPDGKGKLLFFQIDRPDKGKWTDWTFVRRYLGGQGAVDRVGSQKPGYGYKGGSADLMAAVVADPKGAMKAFADELGICARCSRDLTDPTSRERGIGPECWKAVA